MLIVKRHGGSVYKINAPMSNLQEENHLKVMRLLVEDPRMSQRELAAALGMSLGKTNYCIKALMVKGLIKVNNFRSHKNKLAYAYLLTPQGIAEKANLTAEFLRRKLDEYERLKDEIQMLKREVLKQGNLGWPGADY
jgi:EPS-associated MarR family transcriptional regulator